MSLLAFFYYGKNRKHKKTPRIECIPIEHTRCGTCRLFENNKCPHGNHRGMIVFAFFAEKCLEWEEVEK